MGRNNSEIQESQRLGRACGDLEVVEKRELGNTRGCFLLAGLDGAMQVVFSLPCVGTGRIQLDVHLRQDELQCNERERLVFKWRKTAVA